MARSEKLTFILVLTAGILVPGLAEYALTQAGFDRLGVVVWVTGYAGAVLYIWYRWLRPLDITGPD